MAEALEAYTVEIEQLFEAGDKVVVLLTSRGRGRISGADVSRKLAQVVTVRNGLVTEIVGYDDRVEALESVGLSEQDAHADS
jgi:ketosteroid isomerase-like protein